MTFRKATQADAGRCLAIYNAVCDWEEVHGAQTCWKKGWYPSEETVRDALILHTFGVPPDLQRRGYGQAFISFYRNTATSLGCRVLRLDTLITNQKSQAMYRKLGFSRAGQTEADVDNAGVLYTLVGYEKAV